MSEQIISRSEDGVGHLVFNNPEKRNAVSLAMWQAVERALDAFAQDETVRALVLSGAGGKAFVSGADISKFEDERASAAAVALYDATTARVSEKLAAFAEAHDRADHRQLRRRRRGARGLLRPADLRRELALRHPGGAARPRLRLRRLKRLVDVIGPAFAKELLFTARLFSAAEAYAMGLVNRVLPDDQVASFVADYARTIRANAPLTIAAAKATIGEILKDPDARDLARCEALVAACFASQDYTEGRRAFLEKRQPQFIGA